jgi:hypothetical protein
VAHPDRHGSGVAGALLRVHGAGVDSAALSLSFHRPRQPSLPVALVPSITKGDGAKQERGTTASVPGLAGHSSTGVPAGLGHPQIQVSPNEPPLPPPNSTAVPVAAS